MAVTLGAKPLAGFTQPIEMMTDCHRRIEHFLGVLQKVEQLFGDRQLNEEARRALVASLDYFAHAAPHHTSDEEQSLFPRMRSIDSAASRAALAELDHLESQHRHAEQWHQRVDELSRLWLAAGRLEEAQRDELRTLLDDLVATYAAHIRVEEEQVFVLAAQTLPPQQLLEIGAEMKGRRKLGSSVGLVPIAEGNA